MTSGTGSRCVASLSCEPTIIWYPAAMNRKTIVPWFMAAAFAACGICLVLSMFGESKAFGPIGMLMLAIGACIFVGGLFAKK